MELVLRVLRGETLDGLSRETSIPIASLEEWQELFLKCAACAFEGTSDIRTQVERIQARVTEVERMLASVQTTLPNLEETRRQTILLVDDDDAVRESIRDTLDRERYAVLEARFNTEALLLCHQHNRRIDLLISDVMMPGTSGPEFAAKLLIANPDLRVLYISGAPFEAVYRKVGKVKMSAFLPKPFAPETLVRTVRQVLR
jgi:CheY-like chemotaxis protein